MENLADNKITIEQQKELYFATIIHDLKNPLNAQISALEQLYKERFGGLSSLQKEILSDTISSSKYMRELLSSILEIFKFENNCVKLIKEEFDIDNLLRICIREETPFADEHCILIQYINSAENTCLYADKSIIKRVIYNMLNNMISYSYKNTKPIISIEDNKQNILLRFKSNGYPINENLKEHIFDKYTSGFNKKSGIGIGLYFCKKAIEAHNGSICLNTNNSDIEFLITLPKNSFSTHFIKFDN